MKPCNKDGDIHTAGGLFPAGGFLRLPYPVHGGRVAAFRPRQCCCQPGRWQWPPANGAGQQVPVCAQASTTTLIFLQGTDHVLEHFPVTLVEIHQGPV